jgi:hypothetical protein
LFNQIKEENKFNDYEEVDRFFYYIVTQQKQYWLISNNPETYDAIGAFKNLRVIDWGNSNNNKIKKDDIIYIYTSKPTQSITVKAKVIKEELNANDLLNNDKDFLKSDIREKKHYFRLELIGFTDQKTLSIENLQKYGLNGYPQGKQKINNKPKLLKYILDNENINQHTDGDKLMSKNDKQVNSLNQILYGPPGTGKTYHTINRALKIIDRTVPEDREEAKKRFDELKANGQIEFITFHQSYGYEEFVEGIKAIPAGETGNENGTEMIYKVMPGVFKRLSKQAKGQFFYVGQKFNDYEVVEVGEKLIKFKKPNNSIVCFPIEYFYET